MDGRPGWEQIIRPAVQTASAQRPVEWRRSVTAAGGLVLAPLDLQSLDLERVRGTVAAARAVSCELCGGPGDAATRVRCQPECQIRTDSRLPRRGARAPRSWTRDSDLLAIVEGVAVNDEELIGVLEELRGTMIAVATGGPRITDVNEHYQRVFAALARIIPEVVESVTVGA